MRHFLANSFLGEKFGLQRDKLENLILAKYYQEGKMSGDEEFPDKSIFGGNIWPAKG
jgi:hypothetical protein